MSNPCLQLKQGLFLLLLLHLSVALCSLQSSGVCGSEFVELWAQLGGSCRSGGRCCVFRGWVQEYLGLRVRLQHPDQVFEQLLLLGLLEGSVLLSQGISGVLAEQDEILGITGALQRVAAPSLADSAGS